MSSLTGYIPALSRILGMTVGALYERQRALVRAGLLDANEGRGPGSGVRATDEAIAILLISVLATDRLTAAAERTQAIATARPEFTQRCPLTGQRTFANALSSILFSTGKAYQVEKIIVSHTADRAEIRYYDGPGTTQSVTFAGKATAEPGIAMSATMGIGLLQEIARDAQAIIDEEYSGSSTP